MQALVSPIQRQRSELVASDDGIAFQISAHTHYIWCLVLKTGEVYVSSARPVAKSLIPGEFCLSTKQSNLFAVKQPHLFQCMRAMTKDEMCEYFWKEINPHSIPKERFCTEKQFEAWQSSKLHWRNCTQEAFYLFLSHLFDASDVSLDDVIIACTATTRTEPGKIALIYSRTPKDSTKIGNIVKRVYESIAPRGMEIQLKNRYDTEDTHQRNSGYWFQRKNYTIRAKSTSVYAKQLPKLSSREKLANHSFLRAFCTKYAITQFEEIL